MTKFTNNKSISFLNSIPVASLESENDNLTKRCKFNFSYMDTEQQAGYSFDNFDKDYLVKLLEKFKDYSRESLEHWTNQPIGKGKGTVLAIYGSFPSKSEFTHPKHVPHQVQWGRFRLDCSGRLVGFIIPNSLHDQTHFKTNCKFDKNTFYVVFIDKDHKFYITGDS